MKIRHTSLAALLSAFIAMGCSSSDPTDNPAPNDETTTDGGAETDAQADDDASTDPDGSTGDPDGSTGDPDGGDPDGGGSYAETILTEGYVPTDIAVGGGWLYFTETTFVRRMPVAGGDAVQVFETSAKTVAARNIAADADFVVWTERDVQSSINGAVRGCPHTGCNGAPQVIPSDGSTHHIALGGDIVAWTSHSKNSVQGFSDDQSWSVQIAAPSKPGDVAIDGNDIFYASTGQLGVGTNAIFSCDASGGSCSSSSINDLAGVPISIAVAGDVVLALTDAGLFRMDRDGGNEAKLADNLAKINADVVTDGTTAFWGVGGQLFACEIASCTAETIGTVEGQVTHALALDDDYVYWATADLMEQGGSIRRYKR